MDNVIKRVKESELKDEVLSSFIISSSMLQINAFNLQQILIKWLLNPHLSEIRHLYEDVNDEILYNHIYSLSRDNIICILNAIIKTDDYNKRFKIISSMVLDHEESNVILLTASS